MTGFRMIRFASLRLACTAPVSLLLLLLAGCSAHPPAPELAGAGDARAPPCPARAAAGQSLRRRGRGGTLPARHGLLVRPGLSRRGDRQRRDLQPVRTHRRPPHAAPRPPS